MTKFVRGPGVITPPSQDLGLDQSIQWLDHLHLGALQKRAEKIRRERASNAGRRLNDAPPAVEPVEPFGHDLGQGQRKIVLRPPPAAGMRALADEREDQLLDEQRDAVAGGRRPGQQLFGNRLRPGNGLRQFEALLAP